MFKRAPLLNMDKAVTKDDEERLLVDMPLIVQKLMAKIFVFWICDNPAFLEKMKETLQQTFQERQPNICIAPTLKEYHVVLEECSKLQPKGITSFILCLEKPDNLGTRMCILDNSHVTTVHPDGGIVSSSLYDDIK